MFPVSAPGSAAWQPDPGWRLLHGIVTSWKYGHLSRFPKVKIPMRRTSVIMEPYSVSGR